MDKLVQWLGITSLSKSQVSNMAGELDAPVEQFRTLADAGPSTFVAVDALVLKVREGGRGSCPCTRWSPPAWTPTGPPAGTGHAGHQQRGRRRLAFFRDLVARGLTRMKLVTSDARRATVPHPLRREPDEHPPKSSWAWVKALLHSVYDQADAAPVHAQFDRVADALAEKLPRVAEHLENAREDILAFTAFPQEIWRQIWSNNPNERLNKEIRRRTDVLGSSPTGTRSSASSAPSWPSSTTNGPKAAATSGSTSSPEPSAPPDREGDRRTDPASHRGLTQPQRRITPDTPRQRT